MISDEDLEQPRHSGEDADFNLRGAAEHISERVGINARTSEPLCYVLFGAPRLRETVRAEAEIAPHPTGADHCRLRLRRLAKEIATRIVNEHAIALGGGVGYQGGLVDLTPLPWGVSTR